MSRVLLSEGSSLTARETVGVLAAAGHQVEVLDPDPWCLCRFSRWVRRVHRCPAAGRDPEGYLRRVGELLRGGTVDVLLPTHEQAWLLAVGRDRLPDGAPVALAPAAAFGRVQSKIEFARLLDTLGLPQPAWHLIDGPGDLPEVPYPYYLKTPYGTAGCGVRHVVDARTRDAALADLARLADLGGQGWPLLAQEEVSGQYGQVQALFDRGRMVAVHTSVQVGAGVGGSAAARLSVDHPFAREAALRVGRELRWHGGLTLDYFHRDGAARYLECNPRTVEPANAAAAGVDLPGLTVSLTLGGRLPDETVTGRAGVRTHSALGLLLGTADRTGSRRSVLAQLLRTTAGRGPYAGSAEVLTPVRHDPVALVPMVVVAARLLARPGGAGPMTGHAVENYGVGADAVARLEAAGGSDRG